MAQKKCYMQGISPTNFSSFSPEGTAHLRPQQAPIKAWRSFWKEFPGLRPCSAATSNFASFFFLLNH